MSSTIRNIAIIAHVDHGKTTLVDAMLRQSGIFRANEARRRARHGLQRPGARARHHHPRQDHRRPLSRRQDQHRRHARPQRFRRRSRARAQDRRRRHAAGRRQRRPAAADPLRAQQGARSQAAADRRHQQDRPPGRARRRKCSNEIYDLFIDLDATEDQLDFPVLYTNAKTGIAKHDARRRRRPTCGRSSKPSSSTFPPPEGDPDGVLQMLVANLDYSDYLGRLGIGRVFNGTLQVLATTWPSPSATARCTRPRSPSCTRSKA